MRLRETLPDLPMIKSGHVLPVKALMRAITGLLFHTCIYDISMVKYSSITPSDKKMQTGRNGAGRGSCLASVRIQSWPKELVMGCENFSNLCVTERK